MTSSPRLTLRLPMRGSIAVVMRVVWVSLVAVMVALFALSIPARLGQLVTLPMVEYVALRQMGVPVESFAIYQLVMDILLMAAFTITAVLIFWSRPDDWMVFYVSLAMVAFAAAIIPSYEALGAVIPSWKPTITFIHALGVGTAMLVLYIFPTGHFAPRWTLHFTIVGGGWMFLWLIFATSGDSSTALRVAQGVLYTLSSDPMEAAQLLENIRMGALMVVMFLWFATGLFAQAYRYQYVSTEGQRHQTRWVLFGLGFAFFGYFGYNLPLKLIPLLVEPGYYRVLYMLLGQPVYTLSLLLVPAFLWVAVTRNRLWDIDVIINRTLVYGAVTGLLGVLFFGGILFLQRLSLALTGWAGNEFIIALTSLAIAFLFIPLRGRVQKLVDRAFYRERVDFRQAFTDFSQQVRMIIELPELLHVLVQRTTQLYHVKHGGVYLYRDQTFQLADAIELPAGVGLELKLERNPLSQLRAGNTLIQPRDEIFPLLIPLMAPKTRALASEGDVEPLLGVLALGPRLSGLGYFREDIALLRGLADQAGTAIYVARLVEEKQAEAQRLAEAERQIQAHRQSPLGRAEEFSRKMLSQPELRLLELYNLAQTAGSDVHAAELLHNLPQVFFNQGKPDYGRLTQGFEYIYMSRRQPEMLPLGLRTLITQLEETLQSGPVSSDTPLVLHFIRLSLSALEAETNTHLTTWATQIPSEHDTLDLRQNAPHLTDIALAFDDLRAVVQSVNACDRLDTPEDKLSYLAAAVERLGRLERNARTRFGGVDRPIVQGIIEKWLAVITRTMSDLQARAHLTCELLTHHTWQGEVVSVALSLTNDGRSAALNVRVSLVPSPEYTLVDENAQVERLSPGEETQVTLRVRPRLEAGISQFRARFVVIYTDPRGLDQVENFADIVHLMYTTTEFCFIPNPYVVGTPLQPGSPLFFGRDDVVRFIQENLAAAHRNNLVLIGQRRTGKTSLLKQLPKRLGDEYLAVYLDGQSVGLDPGLPNFFLTLATEIAFALEDRGFEIEMPKLEDFATSPALTFERSYLPRVRETIGGRHLLLMLDEFEELEAAVRRGDLDASIFGFLRHLIQHFEGLSVIFCGTHRLEELASDYWSVLFNISLYRHIALLERPEALRLVQEPVSAYGMRYDDLALDKIWRVTAGHPYFLQLLCHSLVNRHNKTQRPYVTVADVNAALDEILASGEAHFVYLWNEANPDDRLTLAALSRMAPLSGHVSAVQVVNYLYEWGITVERQAISEALHRLALRDVLTVSRSADQTGEEYAWKLGLLGLWVEKYKSLNRVVDEVKK